MQFKLGAWRRPHGEDDISVKMGNSHVGVQGKHGQGEGHKGSEVGVNLAYLNDNQEALAGEESGREGKVIRFEVREVVWSARAGNLEDQYEDLDFNYE